MWYGVNGRENERPRGMLLDRESKILLKPEHRPSVEVADEMPCPDVIDGWLLGREEHRAFVEVAEEIPSVFGRNLQYQPVRGVNTRDECH
jgi:hypothetical protein